MKVKPNLRDLFCSQHILYANNIQDKLVLCVGIVIISLKQG